MSHIMQVKLDGFTDGFFVIQPAYNEKEFAMLMQGKLHKDLILPYARVYIDFARCKSGTIVCDDKSPWVIVVFGSDPRLLRRLALHEIVHLSREIMPLDGRQFIFIERAYTAVKIPMEDSYGFSETRRD